MVYTKITTEKNERTVHVRASLGISFVEIMYYRNGMTPTAMVFSETFNILSMYEHFKLLKDTIHMYAMGQPIAMVPCPQDLHSALTAAQALCRKC